MSLPAAAPSPIEPVRLALRPCVFLPVTADKVMVFAPRGGKRLLPTDLARALFASGGFRSIDEHCALAVRARQLPPDRVESFRRQLSELQADGFLLSSAALGPGGDLSPTATRAPITSVGLITRDRPESALASLLSYRRNDVGPRREYVVCDDSASPATWQLILRTAEAEGFRSQLRYLGPREKLEFAAQLAREAHVPPALAEMAVTGGGLSSFTRGANTNAFLLDTAGEPIFCFDDDSSCRPARLAERPSRSVVLSSSIPIRVVPFTDRDAVLAEAREEDCLLLSEHERWLGRPLRDVLDDVPSLRLDGDTDSALICDALEGRGRVAVTFSGIYGDSGSYYNTHYLSLQGPERERLLADRSSYEQCLAGRQVWKTPLAVRLARNAQFQSVAFGADNRALLPPFMPFFRASDSVFAQLLARCFRDDCIATLPWSVHHDPTPLRKDDPRAVFDRAGDVRYERILRFALLAHSGARQPAAPAQALGALGRQLCELASMPRADREAALIPAMAQSVRAEIARLEQALATHKSQPDYWAQDLARTIAALERSLSRPDPLQISEPGMAARHQDDPVGAFLRALGEVLSSWPDLWHAARRLKDKGVRASRPF